jgi:protein-tyrosine phosphatase
VIDLHCHVLAGIDDGPQTMEGSLAMARAAAAAGTRTLVATPHVNWSFDNDPDTIARLVGELNQRLQAEEIPIEVLPGAEVALTRLGGLKATQLSRLGLAGGPWMLVELPLTSVFTGLEPTLLALLQEGRRIILAHPERCPVFHREPGLLASLVQEGVLTSITAGSLVGGFGDTVRRFTLQLVHDRLVHNVASDAHDATRRPPSVLSELRQVGLEPLSDWLTSAVPAAILDGEEIPGEPEVALPDVESRPLIETTRRRSSRAR